MLTGPRFLLLLPFAALLGCGSSPSTQVTSSLSGNWATSSTYTSGSSSSTTTVTGFSGALQFSNGLVTETGSLAIIFNGNGGNCLNDATIDGWPVANGTYDANNTLTLTFPISGGTATYTATLGANPQILADGTFQIIGGTCAMSATPMTIAQYAPLTGTYTGTLSYSNIGNITVTANLTQSISPNADGQFSITGTVNVTGSCTESSTFTSDVEGNLFGNFGINNGSSTVMFFGSFDPTASTINAMYSSYNCAAERQGTLTRE
ncbi:MAG: hypothetical protein ACLQM6_12660 [Acidobacteriaceae bacterium]